MASRELQILLELKDNASKELKGFQGKLKSMKPTFTKMAGIGTAAFAGISTGVFKATQSAINAKETFNKFDVVFKDVSKQSNDVAQDLRDNFGLAESSAKDLLASTGDMLTGFGMSGGAALDLAEKTNKLAVDLASFTNIEGGAQRASKALTKALLGERESVKELGIAILEEDVKAKVETMKAAGRFTNETERQMEAMATLEIATEQSKNAVGDFARTQDSVANQQRVLKERTKELSETLGQTFIPIASDIVKAILPIVKDMATWIKENPKLVKTIIIVSAALAGLIAVIGAVGIAMTVFNPIVAGIILAIAGIVTATIFLGKKIAQVVAWIIVNWDKISESTKNVWNSILNFFKNIWSGIKNVFNSSVNWIMDKLEPLLNVIRKVKSIGGKIGSAIGGAVKTVIPGLAEGGIVRKPTLAMIGEAGPEAVVPLSKSKGVGGNNVTINITGGMFLDRNSAQRIMEELSGLLRDKIRL